jgi:ABC-2 type transport system ATP-binding protein
MNEIVIETKGLEKRFGKTEAVCGIDLKVPKGSVYAFLGRNGAGKSTTIKMLMGLLEPEAGSATVLGLRSQAETLEIKQRTGYVPESPVLYRWMKVREFLRFVSAFFPKWDRPYADELLAHFQLKPDQKVGTLSKGMAAKLALTVGLAHRPELLILDDPTMGLDVIVRREFLESIVSVIQEEGRTVFLSTHQIDEAERVADHIGIIHDGKLLWQSSLEALKNSVRRVHLAVDETFRGLEGIDGVLSEEREERRWTGVLEGLDEAKLARLKSLPGVAALEALHMPLEDIFCALAGGRS